MTLLTSSTRRALHASSRSILCPQARTLFTVIEQGREGWRLRYTLIWFINLAPSHLLSSFGRNPVRLNPGINLNIPLYHSVQVRLVRKRENVHSSEISGCRSSRVINIHTEGISPASSMIFPLHSGISLASWVYIWQCKFPATSATHWALISDLGSCSLLRLSILPSRGWVSSVF